MLLPYDLMGNTFNVDLYFSGVFFDYFSVYKGIEYDCKVLYAFQEVYQTEFEAILNIIRHDLDRDKINVLYLSTRQYDNDRRVVQINEVRISKSKYLKYVIGISLSVLIDGAFSYSHATIFPFRSNSLIACYKFIDKYIIR